MPPPSSGHQLGRAVKTQLEEMSNTGSALQGDVVLGSAIQGGLVLVGRAVVVGVIVRGEVQHTGCCRSASSLKKSEAPSGLFSSSLPKNSSWRAKNGR